MKHQYRGHSPLAILIALLIAFGGFVTTQPTAVAAEVPAGFPNASTTGLSNPSILTKHDGGMTITEDNTVLENMEIHGTIRIEANNVVMRNVWVYSTGFWTIRVDSGSLLIEHSEIGHADYPGERGIGGENITGRYLDIHHSEDGIKLDTNNLYEYIYVHDLDTNAGGPHADAIQADGGAQNAVVRHATLDSTGPLGLGNAAIILKSDLGSIDNILIEDAYLNGGNYTFYSREGGNGDPSNVVLRNSVFGPDYNYGRISIDGTVGFENNKLWDGTPIDVEGDPTAPAPPPPPSTGNGTFWDDDSNQFESEIEALAAAGVTNGCGENAFCPNGSVTRAEMAAFIVRALGESPSSGNSFSDVPSNAWYAGYVNRLAELGVTTGCAPGKFCPSNLVSRAELAVFIVRAVDEAPATVRGLYADVPFAAWYGPHAETLHDLNVTNGCATNPLRYCPGDATTRGQMAALLVRAFDL
jgi:hypothetical protein